MNNTIFRNQNNTNYKENGKENKSKSLTKEDIIEILNSDAVASLKKPLVGALSRLGVGIPLWVTLTKGLGFALLLAAGLIGYYIQWNTELMQRKAETTARAAAQLQKTIDRKIEWQIKLNNSMGSLKEKMELIKLKCDERVPMTKYEQNKIRLLERSKIVYAMMGIQYIFSEKVIDGAREYVLFDESVNDLCGKNAPSEMAWREILIKNNQLMGESIKEDEKKLNQLNSIKKKY